MHFVTFKIKNHGNGNKNTQKSIGVIVEVIQRKRNKYEIVTKLLKKLLNMFDKWALM